MHRDPVVYTSLRELKVIRAFLVSCYSIEENSVLVLLPCPNLLKPWFSSTTSNVLARKSGGGQKQMLNFELNDVLEEITKYFGTPLDYMNFPCVNRRCQSITPLANWRRILSTSSSSEKTTVFQLPLLVSLVNHGAATVENPILKLVDPRQNSIYYMLTSPESHKGTLIVYSNHGWLLTTFQGQFVNLYNPFTKSILSYPGKDQVARNENFFFVQYGDASFRVVSVSFFFREKKVVFTIRPGEESWTRNGLHSNVRFSATHTSPVLFCGSFYYLDHNGNIGRLKVKENYRISWKVLDNPRKPCLSFYPNFLAECGGELLTVCIHCGGENVVCRFNQLGKAWETMTFSVLMMSPELRNRIYLPLVYESEFVFFSLEFGYRQMV